MVYKFVFCVSVSLILGGELIAADDAVDFRVVISKPLMETPDLASDGGVAATNIAIRSSYDKFRSLLTTSTYFCSHNDYRPRGASVTPVHPVIEYMAFLVSLSKDQKIATILGHLVKTAGPFGFSKQLANSAERVIYHLAMNAVSRTLTGKLHEAYKAPAEDTAFSVIQAMHPDIGLVLPTSAERWNTLLDALQDRDFFKSSTGPHSGLSLGTPVQRYSLLNDVFQLSFLLGVTLRYKDGKWLSDIWSNLNAKLESDHDFIQWLFPIRTVGVDPFAPLLNDTIASSLARHPLLLNSTRVMVRISFARMANFWGQRMTGSAGTLIFTKVNDMWRQNWLINTHNNPRMNRILECLSFFRISDEFTLLFKYLEDTIQEATRAGKYPTLKSSMETFWSKVVRLV